MLSVCTATALLWQLVLLDFIIDADHFIYFALRHKDVNFRRAWNAATVRHESGERTLVHHWKGFAIITIIALIISFLNTTVFWAVILGYYSHVFLDYARLREKFHMERCFIIKEKGFRFHVHVFELVFDAVLLVLLFFVLVL